MLLPYAGLLAVLLLFSAFFSGSESAYFSLGRFELEKLEDEAADSRRSRTVRRLLAAPRRLLATILLGNELVNISISAVGLAAVLELQEARQWDTIPWWLNVVVITPLVLIFGEIAPKALAVRTSMIWAKTVSLPLNLFSLLISPIRGVLHGFAEFLLRLFRIEQDDPLPSALQEAQFKALVKLGEKQGVIGSEEAELIHRVFDLADTPVSRIMTPRADTVALPLNSSLDELLSEIRRSRFSRIPLYAGDPDNLKGILMTKDLLRLVATDQQVDPRQIEGLLKTPYFVPPGKPSGELLQEFQVERGHMAVVLDEHGEVLGIVTMQDVLDELFEPVEEVGDRPAGPSVERLSDGLYRIPARMEVTEWNRSLIPALPLGDSYNTVAGYIFHLFGRLPRKGEEIRSGDWSFRVTGLEGTRLTWITAQRLEHSLSLRREP